MHPVMLFPGAGRSSQYLWRRSQIRDDTLIPVDYERFPPKGESRLSGKEVLDFQGEQMFLAMRQRAREPVHVLLHSMAACSGCKMIELAQVHEPGMIEEVAFVNPGVFNGPLDRPFHRDPAYQGSVMWYWVNSLSRIATAIRTIKKECPDFSYEVRENQDAMYASGDGGMFLPEGFDTSSAHLFYSLDDPIVPPHVSEFVAKRAGIQTTILEKGYGHDAPLLDVDGLVLDQIRRNFKNP